MKKILKRLLSCLCTLTVAATTLTLQPILKVEAAIRPHVVSIDNVVLAKSTDPTTNLLQNGDMSNGTNSWTVWSQNNSMTAENKDGVMKLSVTDVGAASWSNQFSQGNLTMEKGVTYVVSFDASSSVDRCIQVLLEHNGDPYTKYLPEQNLGLSSDMKHFTYKFTMNSDTDTGAHLVFALGNIDALSSAHDIYFDNVYLAKNMITNGTMSKSDDKSWLTYGSLTNSIENGEMKLNVTNENNNPWDNILYKSNLTIEKDATYSLSFVARSSVARKMDVTVEHEGDPYTKYLQPQTVNLATYMQKYSFEFTDASDTDASARLTFELGKNGAGAGAAHDVYIDNVILTKVAAPGSDGNLLKNGTMDGTIDPWNASGCEGSIVDGEAKLTLQGAGDYNYSRQFIQSGLSIETGADYVASFDVHSSLRRFIQVDVEQNGGSYKNYMPAATVLTNQDKKTYTFEFSTSEPTDNAARFVFQIGKVYNYVAPVTANPASEKITVPTQVTLSTATVGANIYYSIGAGETQLYTAPITVNPGDSIIAYSTKDGMDDSDSVTFKYSSAADETIDRWGQMKNVSFPDKVTSDEDLKADVAKDEQYYNSLNAPADRDAYGGLKGTKEQYNLEARGYFYQTTLPNGKNTLVTPDGNIYFDLGVCVAGQPGDTYTVTKGREDIYAWLPDRNDPTYQTAFRTDGSTDISFYLTNKIIKTGKPYDAKAFNVETINRLKKWGFTSYGDFSDNEQADANNFPTVRDLRVRNIGTMSGTTCPDVFVDNFKQKAIDYIQPQIKDHVNDKNLIGYYLDNEMTYETIKTAVPAAKASEVAAKKKLVDMLKEKYKDIAALNSSWGANYSSFDAMNEVPLNINSSAASADMNDFIKLYLDTFYKTMSEVIRSIDNNHMILGDRFAINATQDSTLTQELCEAAGKYMDAVSYNYYCNGDVDVNKIKQMHEWAKKPIYISEYDYTSEDQGLQAWTKTADETEQGLQYRNYVEQLASTGCVIGADWFQYFDQAATGRWFQGFTGEHGGTGLVNVADRPHKTLLNSMMQTNDNIYKIVSGEQAPYKYQFQVHQSNKTYDIPKASGKITIDGVIGDNEWPTQASMILGDNDLVIGNKKEGDKASVKLAWDDTNMYIVAKIKDSTPMMNSNTGVDVWNGDALELFIAPNDIDKTGAMQPTDSQVILSGGKVDGVYQYHWYNGSTTQRPLNMEITKDADGQGYTIEAAIPLSSLLVDGAKAGKQVRLDVAVDDGNASGRQKQWLWNGVANNSASREKWAKVTFADVNAGPATPTPTATSTPTPVPTSTSVPVVPTSAPATPTATPTPTPTNDGNAKDTVLKDVATSKDSHNKTIMQGMIDSEKLMKKVNAAGANAVVTVPMLGNADIVCGNLNAQLVKDLQEKNAIVEIQTDNSSYFIPTQQIDINDISSKLGKDVALKDIVLSVKISDVPEDTKAVLQKAAAALNAELVGSQKNFEVTCTANDKIVDVKNYIGYVKRLIAIPADSAKKITTGVVLNSDGSISQVPTTIIVKDGKYYAQISSLTNSTYGVVEHSLEFADVDKHWSKNEVNDMASRMIINGYPDGTFKPDNSVTRGEFAKILVTALGLQSDKNEEAGYTDLSKDNIFYGYIAQAKKYNLIKGYEDGTFKVDATISRQEVMAMIQRAMSLTGLKNNVTESEIETILNKFVDNDKIGSWARNAAATCINDNIIIGSDNKLEGTTNLSRAEAVTIVKRLLSASGLVDK